MKCQLTWHTCYQTLPVIIPHKRLGCVRACVVHVQWLMLCTLCNVAPTLRDSWGEKVSLAFSPCCLHPLFRFVDDPSCISGTYSEPAVTWQWPWWIESGCCMCVFVFKRNPSWVLFPLCTEWSWTPMPSTIFPNSPDALTASLRPTGIWNLSMTSELRWQ